MPKLTLLDMTQQILSDMDSDEVNSISDTVESSQVAGIIQSIFYDLVANRRIPEHMKLVQLTALSDSAKPNYLQYPSAVTQVQGFKYDKRDSSTDTKINYDVVPYMHPNAFLQMLDSRDSSATNVSTIADDSGISLLIKTDGNPVYWTTFDDDFIVCDSYDSAIDTTLQQSKTQAWAEVEPTFTQSDVFIPDIDTNLFPLLLAAAKVASFAKLKQAPNPVDSSIARSHIVNQQNNRHKLTSANESVYPNYGRK